MFVMDICTTISYSTVPSESLSEDDQQDTKTVTKYRYSKRKGLSSKASVSSANGMPPALLQHLTSLTLYLVLYALQHSTTQFSLVCSTMLQVIFDLLILNILLFKELNFIKLWQ